MRYESMRLWGEWHFKASRFIYKSMSDFYGDRAIALGRYIAENGATVRDAAVKFGMAKSTVHKEVTERLRSVNPALAAAVRGVLDRNLAERHIRGGEATKRKFMRGGR